MILWILFIAIEIARNYYIIEGKKQKPVYFESFIIRGMAAIVHGVFMDITTGIYTNAWKLSAWELLLLWLPLLSFQVLSFWILFDIGLNLFRGKHPLYYNKSGWIENSIGKHPAFYYGLKLAALVGLFFVI